MEVVTTGNTLVWWKRNSILYPNLAALARKYLAIQATSASSERIFSSAAHRFADHFKT